MSDEKEDRESETEPSEENKCRHHRGQATDSETGVNHVLGILTRVRKKPYQPIKSPKFANVASKDTAEIAAEARPTSSGW